MVRNSSIRSRFIMCLSVLLSNQANCCLSGYFVGRAHESADQVTKSTRLDKWNQAPIFGTFSMDHWENGTIQRTKSKTGTGSAGS